jgi:hypothetical protein
MVIINIDGIPIVGNHPGFAFAVTLFFCVSG